MPKNVEKFTPRQIAAALYVNNGNVTLAARALRCARATVNNYLNRYPKLRQLREALDESVLDIAESALQQKVREGNVAAIIFLLKTKGKHRGYVERTELSGGPMEVRTSIQLPEGFGPNDQLAIDVSADDIPDSDLPDPE